MLERRLTSETGSILKRYASIARPDHWIKNIFMLPGTALALALYPELAAGRSFSRHVLSTLIALISTCLIASANYTINEWLDADSHKFQSVKASRPAVGPCFVVVLVLAVGVGARLQCRADPQQGQGLYRRAERIDQQPVAAPARLERNHRFGAPAHQRAGVLLDGRRVSHGDQAIRRVPDDRRSRAGGALPAVLRELRREEAADLGGLLRDQFRVFPGDFPGQIPVRVPGELSVLRALVLVVSLHLDGRARARHQPGKAGSGADSS